jgi:hypothetical protein
MGDESRTDSPADRDETMLATLTIRIIALDEMTQTLRVQQLLANRPLISF